MSRTPHYNLQRLQRRQSSADLDMEKIAEPTSSSEEQDVHEVSVSRRASSATSVEEDNNQFYDPYLDTDSNYGSTYEDEDSPYPEVRSAVANTDDPLMPCSTLRAWILGMVWATVLPGVNAFFFFRYPSVEIGNLVSLLLVFPIGWAIAAYTPRNTRLFGLDLNPGPFTIKEHVLVSTIGSVGIGPAYALNMFAVQRVFYGQTFDFGYQWLVVVSSQVMGFSVGGILQRVLVAPASMIWPTHLVTCALLNTIHSLQYAGVGTRGGLTRQRFFSYAFVGAFAWYFLPGYLFQALSYFSWVTWIWPESATVAQVFGVINGMGLLPLTFDWCQIAYIVSPLAIPWWAQANILSGFLFFFWFLTPIFYFTNVWNAQYMPMWTSVAYDNTQQPYNLTRVLDENKTLDYVAYQEYSPVQIPTAYIIINMASFASIPAVLVYAIFYHSDQIRTYLFRSRNEPKDVHALLMEKYSQVPAWWYGAIFVTTFIAAVIAIELWQIGLPVWALILALALALVYSIPAGIIMAITGQEVGLHVLTALIYGYARPGQPVPLMVFKTYGYMALNRAKIFSYNMKLGHYMKVPPRSMFLGQLVGSVIAATAQLGVYVWMFSNIDEMCMPDQPNGFSCPATQVFHISTIIWGVIGPSRLFSVGTVYSPITLAFIAGALAPIVTWWLTRRYPQSFMRYVKPVALCAIQFVPQAGAINYVPLAVVGYVFQNVLRKRRFSWWTKYNYVLSAALDAGTATSVIVIFFALQYPRNGTIGQDTIQRWWGNTVAFTGADARGVPMKLLNPGETFGPDHWE